MSKEDVKEVLSKETAKRTAEADLTEEKTGKGMEEGKEELKDECKEMIDAFKKDYVSCETPEKMLEICGRVFESLKEYKTEKDIRQYIELWAYMEARAGLISDDAADTLNNAFYDALKEKFVWLYRNGKPELAWKLNERCFKFFDQYFYNLNSDENFFFQLILAYYTFIWSRKLESNELYTSIAESCYRYYRSNKRRLLKNPESGAAQNTGRLTASFVSNTVLNLQETEGLMLLIDYLKGTFNKSSGTDAEVSAAIFEYEDLRTYRYKVDFYRGKKYSEDKKEEFRKKKAIFIRELVRSYTGYGEKPVYLLKHLGIIGLVMVVIYTFMPGLNNMPENIGERIVAAVYYFITTSLTIGYGDIYPLTWFARIVVIFNEVAGFAIGGAFISLFLRKVFRD